MQPSLPNLSGLATLIRSVIATAVFAGLILLAFGFAGRQPEVRDLLKEQDLPASIEFLKRQAPQWERTYLEWPQALYEQYRNTPAFCIEQTEVNDLQRARCAGVKRELYVEAGILAVPPILLLLIFWSWLGAGADWLWLARNSYERSRLMGTIRIERVLKKRFLWPGFWGLKRGIGRREIKLERGHWITVYIHPRMPEIKVGSEVELFSSVGSKEWSVRPLAVTYSRYLHVKSAKSR